MIEGLYIHVPFCDGKCHYCAFYSVPYHISIGAAWLEALKTEWEWARHEFGPFRLSTVFMGGGTPSMLPPHQLEALLSMIRETFPADPDTQSGTTTPLTARCPQVPSGLEWTSEANPGSLNAEKLAMMKHHGVNRISLGVQSMDDEVLHRLGRRHSVRDIRAAVADIHAAGYVNWGVDLIACVPGVSVDAWRETLDAALALGAPHVSVYALTREEGSKLARDHRAGLIELLDDDEQLRMLDTAEEMLGAAGFVRYEISNYARPGYECRHNLSCWRGGDYLGLGCAASSRVGDRRWTNKPDFGDYLKTAPHPEREEERLPPLTVAVERLIFGLRMAEGIHLEAILADTGLTGTPHESMWQSTLERLQSEGYLILDRGRWSLTAKGRAWADHVAVELMP